MYSPVAAQLPLCACTAGWARLRGLAGWQQLKFPDDLSYVKSRQECSSILRFRVYCLVLGFGRPVQEVDGPVFAHLHDERRGGSAGHIHQDRP